MARSRYSKTGILDGNQYETFTLDQSNRIKEPDTFEGLKTIEYTVKKRDRLDILAARFLNEDRYWWMIALVNNMTLPVLTPGQKIRIPVSATDVFDRL